MPGLWQMITGLCLPPIREAGSLTHVMSQELIFTAEKYRVFKKELYNFESLYKFI
jgi:hypothetical protein